MEESLREANSNKGTPFDSERPTEKAKSTKKEAGNHKKEEVIDSEEDRPLVKNGMSIHGCNPSDVVLSEEVEEDDEGEVPQKGRSSAIQVRNGLIIYRFSPAFAEKISVLQEHVYTETCICICIFCLLML
jgi:hypothetical protein